MYLTTPQFNVLVNTVRNYEAGKPNKIGSIPTTEQTFLIDNGFCLIQGEYIIPSTTGWKKIMGKITVPPEIIELTPKTVQRKTETQSNSFNVHFSGEDSFETMIDYLTADFKNKEPSAITFRNWKLYMNSKKIIYVKGWSIDDFRRANHFIYDNIVDALKESNPDTLHMLLDLLYLTIVVNDFYKTDDECQVV